MFPAPAAPVDVVEARSLLSYTLNITSSNQCLQLPFRTICNFRLPASIVCIKHLARRPYFFLLVSWDISLEEEQRAPLAVRFTYSQSVSL